MRRIFLAGLLGVVVGVAAPPAAALEPSPDIVTWETFPAPEVDVDECRRDATRVASGGFDGGPYLTDPRCNRPRLRLAEPQALVSLYLRTGTDPPIEGDDRLLIRACGPDLCDGDLADFAELTPPGADWTPVTLRDPKGASTIRNILVLSTRLPVEFDDLLLSTSLDQPDTEILSGPATGTGVRDASFTLNANQPLASFRCALDGGALAGCASPLTLTGLAPGPHRLTVAARDRWGLDDPTPVAYDWTIVPDVDVDRVLDAVDNCPVLPNGSQADADADGIGDACETLPDGNVPAVAGRNVIARDVQGNVFVKLPRPAAPRALLQESGFVPLKGVASLPVGSVVDARGGSLAIRSAANSRQAGDRRLRAHQARLAAGIFQIRQTRNRRAPGRRIPTDAVLVSGERAERACVGSTRSRPLKRIVRALTLSGKGFFRAVGGASVATARDARFVTTDRCDGTLTEVGTGEVRVRDRRGKRTVRVRAGRAFLVKRPQFLAIKGQPSAARAADSPGERFSAPGQAARRGA